MVGGGSEAGTSCDVAEARPESANAWVRSVDATPGFEAITHPTSGSMPQPRRLDFGHGACEDVKLALDGFTLDEIILVDSSMLSYLAMISSLIEGRAIDVEELLHVLRRSMRQRRFDRLPRREYVLRILNQHPP